jgi:hypothetical protein
MIRPVPNTGYSSDVRLTLRVGDRLFDVGQVLPDRCMVRDPVDVDPGPAELTISVDGQDEVKNVMLRDGIRSGIREVFFV